MKYATCVGLENPEARRTTAIGLSDIAELYGSGDGSALMDGIDAWHQLAIEREPELQTLISAAFVAPEPEAASKRCYAAMAASTGFFGQRRSMRRDPRKACGPHRAEERIPEL